MNKIATRTLAILCGLGCSVSAFAGNKDRTGQAGASELLINPFAASSGVFGQNQAYVTGLEATKGNFAGLASTNGTEISFNYTALLRETGVNVTNLGFAQQLGEAGALGINLQSVSYGEINTVTYNTPEPGAAGSFRPQFINLQVGYAQEFNQYVRVGFAGTFVNEQIPNARASGACFEAGIQYQSGFRKNFHFGVTLRNVGTNMRFTGQGFAINSEAPENPSYQLNRQTPTEKFELPTYLNIGLAYDFYLDEPRDRSMRDRSVTPKHRLTAMGTFQSNSFNKDYIGVGLEYGFKNFFGLRAGYRYENAIGDKENTTTLYSGFSAGATAQYRINKTGPLFGFDYAFRPTTFGNGVHTFSLRMNFPKSARKAANS